MFRKRHFPLIAALTLMAGCAGTDGLVPPPSAPTMTLPGGAAMPLPRYAEPTGEGGATRSLVTVAEPGPMSGTETELPPGTGPAGTALAPPAGMAPSPEADDWTELLVSPSPPAAGIYRRSGEGILGPGGSVALRPDGIVQRPDGSWSRRTGDVWVHSDGTTTQRNGDVYFHSNGGWTRRSGNSIIDSRGGSCLVSGGTTVCSGK